MERSRQIWLFVLGAFACGEGLPLEDRIISVRPLGVRVEVIQVLDDSVRQCTQALVTDGTRVCVEALPLDRVRIQPWFVDTEAPLTSEDVDGMIEPIWFACNLQPQEGLGACLSNRLPLDPNAIPDCPVLDPTMGLDTILTARAESPCRLTEGLPGEPEYTIPADETFLFGGDLELTMIGHVPNEASAEGLTEQCVAQFFGESDELSSECLILNQRIAIGPDSALYDLAVAAGIPGLGAPPMAAEADRHPAISSFSVGIRDADMTREQTEFRETVTRGEVIVVEPGQVLEIETIVPETDQQQYWIPRDMTAYDPVDEAFSGRWFRTWGTLLGSTSNDPRSINTWTMIPGPQDPIGTGDDTPDRATLYYVLRDGRQGIDWWWIHVDLDGDDDDAP